MRLRGVLFFPVTPFDRAGRLDPGVLAVHIADGLAHGPGGVFVACGTGEFTSLSAEEHAQAVRTAVKTVAGRAPVVAGAGGPVGAALAQAREAAEAGADGLLLFPPYLAKGPDLLGYVRAICAAGLPVICYQRDPLVLDPAAAVELARLPGVAGLKDGVGDIDGIRRIVLAVRRATRGIVPESGTSEIVPESGTDGGSARSGCHHCPRRSPWTARAGRRRLGRRSGAWERGACRARPVGSRYRSGFSTTRPGSGRDSGTSTWRRPAGTSR